MSPQQNIDSLRVAFERAVTFSGSWHIEELLEKKILKEDGTDFKIDINSSDNTQGVPFLHLAVMHQRPTEFLELMIGEGAQPDITDKKGRTALHRLACRDTGPYSGPPRHDLYQVVELFTKRGLSPNACDNKGETPLHVAAACDNIWIARELLDKGADINARDHQGRTPLHIAAAASGAELVYILEHLITVPGIDFVARDKDGVRPIDLARKNKLIKETTLALFEEKASPQIKAQEEQEEKDRQAAADKKHKETLGKLDALLAKKKKPPMP